MEDKMVMMVVLLLDLLVEMELKQQVVAVVDHHILQAWVVAVDLE
jgi:hypothetical protein